jgi:hypothetical protein
MRFALIAREPTASHFPVVYNLDASFEGNQRVVDEMTNGQKGSQRSNGQPIA